LGGKYNSNRNQKNKYKKMKKMIIFLLLTLGWLNANGQTLDNKGAWFVFEKQDYVISVNDVVWIFQHIDNMNSGEKYFLPSSKESFIPIAPKLWKETMTEIISLIEGKEVVSVADSIMKYGVIVPWDDNISRDMTTINYGVRLSGTKFVASPRYAGGFGINFLLYRGYPILKTRILCLNPNEPNIIYKKIEEFKRPIVAKEERVIQYTNNYYSSSQKDEESETPVVHNDDSYQYYEPHYSSGKIIGWMIADYLIWKNNNWCRVPYDVYYDYDPNYRHCRQLGYYNQIDLPQRFHQCNYTGRLHYEYHHDWDKDPGHCENGLPKNPDCSNGNYQNDGNHYVNNDRKPGGQNDCRPQPGGDNEGTQHNADGADSRSTSVIIRNNYSNRSASGGQTNSSSVNNQRSSSSSSNVNGSRSNYTASNSGNSNTRSSSSRSGNSANYSPQSRSSSSGNVNRSTQSRVSSSSAQYASSRSSGNRSSYSPSHSSNQRMSASSYGGGGGRSSSRSSAGMGGNHGFSGGSQGGGGRRR